MCARRAALPSMSMGEPAPVATHPGLSSPPASFGIWIRQRRRALGLTQEELAERAHCSLSAIRKIEGDERRPSREAGERIAAVLAIPAEDRETFLRVARMDLRIDGLSSIAQPDVQPISSGPSLTPGTTLPERSDARTQPTRGDASDATALPLPSTPLIGRDALCDEVAAMLLMPETRIVSLVGPLGAGKSRVALEIARRASARQLMPELAGGVVYVDLARALSVSAAFASLADPSHAIKRGRLLLLVDNVEGDTTDVAAALTAYLQGMPHARALVTSRLPLHAPNEQVVEVCGLDHLAPGAEGEAQCSPAALFFVECARRSDGSFAPSAADWAAIERIGWLVEGSPLAIELAASWVRVLSCSEIAEELEFAWESVAGATRDMPERHQSVQIVRRDQPGNQSRG